LRFEGRRFDCGSRFGFIEAQLGFALADDELKDKVIEMVREMI